MISTPRMAIRPANSWTVMTSGMTTLAGALGLLLAAALRFSRSRSRARRTDARERMRFDGVLVIPVPRLWMVRRPSRRLGSPLGAGNGLAGGGLAALARGVFLVEVRPAVEIEAAGARGLARGALDFGPGRGGRGTPGRRADAEPPGRGRLRAAGAARAPNSGRFFAGAGRAGDRRAAGRRRSR